MCRFMMFVASFLVLAGAAGIVILVHVHEDVEPPPAEPLEAPATPAVDPFPQLPPLSELSRLPSADIAADWSKIQRTVFDDARAKANDPKLPRQLQSKYEDICFETGKRMLWVNKIRAAHDKGFSEQDRRHCLNYLQGFEAYYTGKWPPPVPVELMPEDEAGEGKHD